MLDTIILCGNTLSDNDDAPPKGNFPYLFIERFTIDSTNADLEVQLMQPNLCDGVKNHYWNAFIKARHILLYSNFMSIPLCFVPHGSILIAINAVNSNSIAVIFIVTTYMAS